MRMVDLIQKTRNSQPLGDEEICWIVNEFTSGNVPDYQMSAWMMAVCLKGMTVPEIVTLTMAMMNSGEVMDLSDLPGIKLDKHSTGGVGDTTTLIVAPLVAACGGTVAKLSGRGLGHTGGTLDKLESIPGVSVELGLERFKQIVGDIGICVMGQTQNLVPADKLMYALRDVTATVEGIPLIASSIMSKKLASGAQALVLDVKAGSGAFMHTVDEAKALAQLMVDIGSNCNRKTAALITDMNQPLGMAVGNALEVIEAYDALSGKCDENAPLLSISLLLAEKLLLSAELAHDRANAKELLLKALYSGEGLKKLKTMLYAMGGMEEYVENPQKICRVKQKIDVYPQKAGYIGNMQANMIGVSAMLLGAGRAQKGDKLDLSTGLVMNVRRGDYVAKSDPIATLYVNDDSKLDAAKNMLLDAIDITSEKPESMPILYFEVE